MILQCHYQMCALLECHTLIDEDTDQCENEITWHYDHVFRLYVLLTCYSHV